MTEPARKQELVAAQEPSSFAAMVERVIANPATTVETLERLLDMQERIMAKTAEQAFNEAMTAAQQEMGRISTDATNPQTHSKYATYGKLDRYLRPIYTKHGFALSFDEGESPKDEHIRVLCYVSHNKGHSRTYHKDMPSDGKGPKGNDVMSKTHAAGSAMSYGMRYLLKGVFNVAVGEDDNDGNGPPLEKISEHQVADLEALVSEVGADRARFLKHLKVAKLADLPARAFNSAVKDLEAKRRKPQ